MCIGSFEWSAAVAYFEASSFEWVQEPNRCQRHVAGRKSVASLFAEHAIRHAASSAARQNRFGSKIGRILLTELNEEKKTNKHGSSQKTDFKTRPYFRVAHPLCSLFVAHLFLTRSTMKDRWTELLYVFCCIFHFRNTKQTLQFNCQIRQL